MSGRKPDYVLKVGIKGEKYHRRAGAAWAIKNDGIAIKIDPGTALLSGSDILVTLWPHEPDRERNKNDEDIPF
jgi:hypothetical protein